MNNLIFDLVVANSNISIADIINYSHTSASNYNMVNNMHIYPKNRNIYICGNTKMNKNASYINYDNLLELTENCILFNIIKRNKYDIFMNNIVAGDNNKFIADINIYHAGWQLITSMTISMTVDYGEINLQYFKNLKKLIILKHLRNMVTNIPPFCRVTYI